MWYEPGLSSPTRKILVYFCYNKQCAWFGLQRFETVTLLHTPRGLHRTQKLLIRERGMGYRSKNESQ